MLGDAVLRERVGLCIEWYGVSFFFKLLAQEL